MKDIPELTLDLVAIRKRAFGESGPREPWEVAEHLGIPHVEANDPPSIARLVAMIWMRSIDDLEGESVTTLSDLERVIDAVLEATDFAGKAFGPQDVLALPDAPGIYRFADRRRRTLYVGRSAALRARVSSYFLGSPRDDKDRAIREHAVYLVTRRSASAVDAWIDEARAIERFAPRLNTQRAVHLDVSRDGVLLVPAADDE
ncbi:MAG: nucleotide excision repair endonuclease, partial [Acidobacteria bacterium]|nr:nucleotide excision repair endonuclease [Acidobacteriota bacterium]